MTNQKKGYLLIVLGAMLYSTTEVALKALGGCFQPMQITVERVLIGGAFLLPFALRHLRENHIVPDKSDWIYFAVLGFLTVTLHMSCLQLAVIHMDASATAIIYSGNPVFAAAAACLILKEPLRRNHLLAIFLEVVGILIILNPAHLELSVRGFAEIMIATVLFAMYGTLCKLRMKKFGSVAICAFCMVLGALELLALLLLGELPPIAALYRRLGLELFACVPFFTGFTVKSTLLLCYVGIFCAAFGMLITAKITEYTSAIEASFIYFIKPVLATVLAVAVFGESISIHRKIGIVFFMAASLCVSVPVLREMRKAKKLSQ